MSDVVATLAGEYQFIAPAKIHPSKTNPRTRFDATKMAELVTSVKAHGLLEPCMVRLMPGKPVASGEHELIFGHRRMRAATAAALPMIPCIVKVMTDEQVCEVQVIENEQRDDLHPLEAAQGYRDLIHTFKHSIDDVAAKVGKSTGYIMQRLKLLDLDKTVQKMFLDDKITLSIAQLIARIPVKELHKQAAQEVTALQGGMTTSDARDHIMRSYMLDLKVAPFDPANALLVESAGACGVCPKRTGNQSALFADITKGDLCTDPVCFKNKCAAHTSILLADARKSGQVIIEGKKAKEVKPYRHGLAHNTGFIEMDHEVYAGGKVHKASTVLGKDYKTALLVDPDNPNKVIQLAKESDFKAALKEKGLTSRVGSNAVQTPDDIYTTRKRNFDAKNEALIKHRIFEATHTAVTGPLSLDLLRTVVAYFWSTAGFEPHRHVTPLWVHIEKEKKDRNEYQYQHSDKVAKLIATMDAIELQRLLVDIVCGSTLGSYGSGDRLFALAKQLGVDIATHKQDVKNERAARAPKKPEPPKKAKPAKKAKAKK